MFPCNERFVVEGADKNDEECRSSNFQEKGSGMCCNGAGVRGSERIVETSNSAENMEMEHSSRMECHFYDAENAHLHGSSPKLHDRC